MADEQFASLICSQLKIGLAHRGAKTSGRKYDLLQILYDDYIVSQRIQLPGSKLSDVHNVVYNQAVGVRNLFDHFAGRVNIYVEYSQMMLNLGSYQFA